MRSPRSSGGRRSVHSWWRMPGLPPRSWQRYSEGWHEWPSNSPSRSAGIHFDAKITEDLLTLLTLDDAGADTGGDIMAYGLHCDRGGHWIRQDGIDTLAG